MGGTVSVKSKEGVGSTFKIEISTLCKNIDGSELSLMASTENKVKNRRKVKPQKDSSFNQNYKVNITEDGLSSDIHLTEQN